MMNGGIISSSKDKTLPQLFVVRKLSLKSLVLLQLCMVA